MRGLWEQALRHYRAQRWNEAEMILRELHRMGPALGLYAVYLAGSRTCACARRRRNGTA